MNLVYVPSMRNGPGQHDRGNAILSTAPLSAVRAVELSFEKQRRVAIVARASGRTAAGEPWELTVANLHFDTSAGLTRGGPGATRSRQAEGLIEILNESEPPIVVGGDLNTWWGDDEPVVETLRREFPDARGIPERDTWRGPFGASSKLDYVFARTDGVPLQVRRIPERFGSDHYPLIITLPVRPPRR
jgi:endonuclease/exonuclease/phosphatase family metal-dependent hydrolase